MGLFSIWTKLGKTCRENTRMGASFGRKRSITRLAYMDVKTARTAYFWLETPMRRNGHPRYGGLRRSMASHSMFARKHHAFFMTTGPLRSAKSGALKCLRKL